METATNMSTVIDDLIQRQDSEGLLRLLLKQADGGDPALMLATVRYLQLLDSHWLHSVLWERDTWLLLYIKREPGDLLALLEYAYFAAHYRQQVYEDPGNASLIAIDLLLGVNYVNKFSLASRGDSEATPPTITQYLTERSSNGGTMSLYKQWFNHVEGPSVVDSCIVGVPYNRPREWTVFHLKMRRIAFWILCRVASLYGSRVSSQLGRYVALLRNKSWRGTPTLLQLPSVLTQYDANELERDIYDFFSPPENPLVFSVLSGNNGNNEGPYSENDWRSLVYDCILRVEYDESLAQIEPSVRILGLMEQSVANQTNKADELFGFIPGYNTPEMRTLFLAMITRVQ